MFKVKEKNAYDGLFLIRNASIIKEMHQGKLLLSFKLRVRSILMLAITLILNVDNPNSF